MLIIIQLIAIYYLGVYGLFEFTSPTNAAFNDIERLTLSLKAADEFEPQDDDGEDEEWDKSSLEFKKNGEKVHCQEGTISAVIQNGSDSRRMQGPVIYEVYWTEKGNPKPDKGGTKVESGQVPPLDSGETFEMFYEPTKPGHYMFRALQRSGHPGKGELWSESIKVAQTCISNHKQRTNTIEKHELEPIIEEQNETNGNEKDEKEGKRNPNKNNKQPKQPQSQELENKGETTNEVSNKGGKSTDETQQEDVVKGADNSDENNNEMD